MGDSMIECPVCWHRWPDDTEQAAAVREYGRCIVCCVTAEKLNGLEWSVKRVQANRAAYLANQCESKEYQS